MSLSPPEMWFQSWVGLSHHRLRAPWHVWMQPFHHWDEGEGYHRAKLQHNTRNEVRNCINLEFLN